MSEYQCYEFVALDRPLTPKQMAELRDISTRADITPTRFWNEYQWGNLKADPAKLLERYFDAHLYFANWGTRRLMFRLPAARVDEKHLHPYFPGGAARMTKAGEHVVIELVSDTEEPEDDFTSGVSLASLAPVRSELLRGDLRAAYLAWLLAVEADDVEDDETEPPLPPGLRELSAPLEAMVGFLRLDGDLLAAAAEPSGAEPEDADALRAWVGALPARTKDQWLRRAVDEPELALGAELRRVFRARVKAKTTRVPRTVAELRAAAEERREKRERAVALRAERSRKAAEAARAKQLDALARRLDAAWSELEALVAKRAYDEALKLAIDLRDLAARDGTNAAFTERFKAMRKQQSRRRSFFDRWKRENEPRRW
ncbi:hypothetical protein WME95_17785 [Sorangium sp. So ce327]|uniref:hypothetical protein n=1 Tax=Sorangium sp. So ce327 TaxID=3133301 RepID=UPI003F5DACB2